MKVLCIADHVDPLIYSSALKARFSDIDFVISAGDLSLEYYDFIISVLNKPLFFVFGNHCLDGRREFTGGHDLTKSQSAGSGATYLEGRVVKQKGVILAGLGGSNWYNGGENQYTDASMFLSMIRLFPKLIWNKLFRGRYLDMLVTHAPPYGINDLPDPCHKGFKIFLWFMRVFKPKYLIHGHVHLYDRNAAREGRYWETRVINAYDHVVVEWENG
jgi:Icc-related predicted phosphoesterase